MSDRDKEVVKKKKFIKHFIFDKYDDSYYCIYKVLGIKIITKPLRLKIDMLEKNIINKLHNIAGNINDNTWKVAGNINDNTWKVAGNINENLEKTSQKLFMNIKAMSLASDIHKETFGPFKNIHKGQDIVLVATGPSLANFKPIKNAIYVGVNKSYRYDKAALDYLFVQDALITRAILDEISEYNKEHCKKFFGLMSSDWVTDIRISYHDTEKNNAYNYIGVVFSSTLLNKPTFHIDSSYLWCSGSVVFSAMQFIFWTNPKKIYLVGCDCSTDGYFNSNNTNTLDLDMVIKGWKEIKKFRDTFYPDTEIISVNPVGLQGLFKDIYQ